jgi:hypothetical protein
MTYISGTQMTSGNNFGPGDGGHKKSAVLDLTQHTTDLAYSKVKTV